MPSGGSRTEYHTAMVPLAREGQVPRGRQYELHLKTRGALKADGFDPRRRLPAIGRTLAP